MELFVFQSPSWLLAIAGAGRPPSSTTVLPSTCHNRPLRLCFSRGHSGLSGPTRRWPMNPDSKYTAPINRWLPLSSLHLQLTPARSSTGSMSWCICTRTSPLVISINLGFVPSPQGSPPRSLESKSQALLAYRHFSLGPALFGLFFPRE